MAGGGEQAAPDGTADPTADGDGERAMPDIAADPAADLSLRLAAGDDFAGLVASIRVPALSVGPAPGAGGEVVTVSAILPGAGPTDCAGVSDMLRRSEVSPSSTAT